jgi:prepilin-type N-terminal cleavage/methylation domain-containing protein
MKKSWKRAFTLIELLIVVAIIGVLAGAFISFYPAAQKRARDGRRQSDISQYRTALEKYANNNNGNYIVGSNINIQGQCSTLGLGSSCVDDPLGGTRHYIYYGTALRYVLYSPLEASSTNFIVCSNGKTGTSATAPSSDTCPL